MKQLACILFSGFLFINCGKMQQVKSISTSALKALLSKEKIQLIDVRTPKEIEGGYIETALFINYFDVHFVDTLLSKLDKNKAVCIYCKSGGRSEKAVKKILEKGYEAYTILGGYKQWKQEN